MIANPIPIEIFCSYAHEDESLRQQIEQHLSLLSRQGFITLWHNRLLLPGTDWAQAIDTHLETASLILLLISASFFSSDYCFSVELQRALQRHDAKEAHVLPILLRAVDWKIAPIAHLQVLPTNAKPITSWANQDEAFADIVAGIRRVIADLPMLSASLPGVALPALWNIPYPRNPFFLGRDELLLHLHRSLLASQAMTYSQPLAVSGLGGIGKTQLLVEYAYRFHQEYEVVLWARAENRDTLFSSYAEFATLLSLPERMDRDQELIIKSVKIWLQRHRKWLLILDNADDLDLVSAFLPFAPGGHLLLTTRAQDMQQLAQRVEINVLQPEQGALFLLHRAGLLAPNAFLGQASAEECVIALELVTQMGGLPLALDQAGAYLEATKMSLEEYRRVYRQHRQVLHRQRRTRILDHPESLATTWTLSFQKVEQHNPAAAALLRLCAFLAPDAIPEEMIMQGASYLGNLLEAVVADPFQMGQAIEVLRLYSLIDRNPQTKTLSVHRLVQVILRDSMDATVAQIWLKRAIKVVAKTRFQIWDIYSDPDRAERLHNQVQACLEYLHEYAVFVPEIVELHMEAGAYLSEYGHYQEAQILLEQALQISEQADDVEVKAMAMHELARIYRRMGMYAEAESLFLQSLAISEHLEPETPDLATTLNVLAFLYAQQGRYTEAKPLFLRALAIYERLLGPEDLDTAQCLSNLGFFYSQQGEYNQAEQFYRRALTIEEQKLGSDHPNVALRLHRLALIYQKQENNGDAELLYQRALLIYTKKKLSQTHSYVQSVRRDYASLLRKMGRDEEQRL